MKDIHNQHINQHYVKFNTEELKRLVQIITVNREEDMLVVRNRIQQVLGMKEDPIDKFHKTIKYYDDKWLHYSYYMGWKVSVYKVSLRSQKYQESETICP